MYITRAEIEMKYDNPSKERKRILSEVWEASEKLVEFCAENNIGAFEFAMSNGRVSYFPGEKLPSVKVQYYDTDAPKEIKDAIHKAMKKSRALAVLLYAHNIGGYDAITPRGVIAYAPRP